MKLQRIDRDGLELVVNLEDGSVYASQSAVARMVDRNESTIRSFLTSRDLQLLSAEIITTTGLKTSRLLNEEQILVAIHEYKPELLIQCAKAGLRLFLHELAGFHYSISQPVVQPRLDAQLIDEIATSMSKVAKTYVEIQETVALYNARLAQIYIDRMTQAVTANQNLLSASSEPQLSGCVEIATKLGYNVGKEESSLGRHVAKAWRNAYDNAEPQISKRECGGAVRSLKVYPNDDPVVTSAIKEYYAKRTAKL